MHSSAFFEKEICQGSKAIVPFPLKGRLNPNLLRF